jgi:hypothetical protein
MRSYPKLMCYKAMPDNCVVYFSNPTTGIVVHSDLTDEPMGTMRQDWKPDEWEDVSNDVVIWLTEGPHDLIHEAIEMVEKVKSLREGQMVIGLEEQKSG